MQDQTLNISLSVEMLPDCFCPLFFDQNPSCTTPPSPLHQNPSALDHLSMPMHGQAHLGHPMVHTAMQSHLASTILPIYLAMFPATYLYRA